MIFKKRSDLGPSRTNTKKKNQKTIKQIQTVWGRKQKFNLCTKKTNFKSRKTWAGFQAHLQVRAENELGTQGGFGGCVGVRGSRGSDLRMRCLLTPPQHTYQKKYELCNNKHLSALMSHTYCLFSSIPACTEKHNLTSGTDSDFWSCSWPTRTDQAENVLFFFFFPAGPKSKL